MENPRKREQAITLITLVITIIILLFFAGVTIVTFMGSGLFGQTRITLL